MAKHIEGEIKSFVFIGQDNKPYYYKENWLYWWHPDNNWVSLRKVPDEIATLLSTNLTSYEQSLYFKNSKYKPIWYTELNPNSRSDFCICGQIKHVGYDQCSDCLDVYEEG